MRLRDKIVIITGAGSGMGRAMTQRFAAEGALLVIGDRNATMLEEAAAEIRAQGGQAKSLVGDISVRADAEALVDLALSVHGRVDGLVNNAGVLDLSQPVGGLDDEVWYRVLGVNLNGTMFTTRRAIPGMLERAAGSIVNIGSFASTSGAASGVAYAASKHGVIGLTRNTAWMYAQCGVRCNAILPGGTTTNIVHNLGAVERDAFGQSRIRPIVDVMPSMMPASEIAAAAVFLLSDESRHVNGALLPIDGGWGAI